MKKYTVLLLTLILTLVSGCSDNIATDNTESSKESEVLVDQSNSQEINNKELLKNGVNGIWIDYNGEEKDNEEYFTTDYIDVDFKEENQLNVPAYISYYDNEKYLETKKYLKVIPIVIEEVEKANNVKISLEAKHLNEDTIIFSKK